MQHSNFFLYLWMYYLARVVGNRDTRVVFVFEYLVTSTLTHANVSMFGEYLDQFFCTDPG